MTERFIALKGLATANGYTHPQLARAVGMSYAKFKECIRGALQFDLDEAYRVLDFFGVPHNQLHLIFPPEGMAEAAKNNAPISSLPHVIRAKYVLKEIEELE